MCGAAERAASSHHWRQSTHTVEKFPFTTHRPSPLACDLPPLARALQVYPLRCNARQPHAGVDLPLPGDRSQGVRGRAKRPQGQKPATTAAAKEVSGWDAPCHEITVVHCEHAVEVVLDVLGTENVASLTLPCYLPTLYKPVAQKQVPCAPPVRPRARPQEAAHRPAQ